MAPSNRNSLLYWYGPVQFKRRTVLIPPNTGSSIYPSGTYFGVIADPDEERKRAAWASVLIPSRGLALAAKMCPDPATGLQYG